MSPCVCGHYHVLKCRRCTCQTFLADAYDVTPGPDWNPGKDSYRFEAVQALRGDVAL